MELAIEITRWFLIQANIWYTIMGLFQQEKAGPAIFLLLTGIWIVVALYNM